MLDPIRHEALRRGCCAGRGRFGQGLYLIVSDIELARTELIAHGVAASEVFHCSAGYVCRFPGKGGRVLGPQPERGSYGSFVSFRDPDGNSWLLQEVTKRLPGRVSGETTYGSASELAQALRRVAAAHGQHEQGSVKPTQTGRTGTPTTWFGNRLATCCRNERTQPTLDKGCAHPCIQGDFNVRTNSRTRKRSPAWDTHPPARRSCLQVSSPRRHRLEVLPGLSAFGPAGGGRWQSIGGRPLHDQGQGPPWRQADATPPSGRSSLYRHFWSVLYRSGRGIRRG
jgi:hypothetical protein